MSIIRDASLSAEGIKKIDWVRGYMPILDEIEKEFSVTKPFSGVRIAMSIHLEAKTARFAHMLKMAGAEVFASGCNSLSTKDDVCAGLDSLGIEVNAVHGCSDREYYDHLKTTLSHKPDVIVDDGGDFIKLLHEECPEYGANLIGGCEETTTGINRLKAMERAGILRYPMIDVNDANSKHLFDNRYGTGQSVMDGIMNATNVLIAGKNLVVAGYGWCGRGIAMRAKGMGARVIVTEVDEFKALEASMDGFTVMKMSEAAELGDIFVTATGCKDVIVKEHFLKMKNGAILANAGHFNVEVDVKGLEEISAEKKNVRPYIDGYLLLNGRRINLLSEGKLVNITASNGHPADIMDMSFSIQALSCLYMAKNGKKLSPGLYATPEEIDRKVAQIKLRSMGVGMDELSESQKKYLNLI
ncbi:MAG: adenosylhomocysteinase [Oscillospiraceae bacterium]|nr:adenosylhomocysteinase [Oscillospiraceae bacterium]